MKDLNIYEDTRNRGLEVLLYNPGETKEEKKELKKFKITIPFRNREFNFEFYITYKSTTPEIG